MIEISNNVKIKQFIELTNEETNEVSYLILDDDSNEWKHITKEEHDKLRGYNNG